MNLKSKYLFFIFIAILILLGSELFYLQYTKTLTQDTLEKKKLFVSICGLPDLAISTEATYIRHRTLTNVFAIYKDDASLREYMFSTFTLSHSHLK